MINSSPTSPLMVITKLIAAIKIASSKICQSHRQDNREAPLRLDHRTCERQRRAWIVWWSHLSTNSHECITYSLDLWARSCYNSKIKIRVSVFNRQPCPPVAKHLSRPQINSQRAPISIRYLTRNPLSQVNSNPITRARAAFWLKLQV